MARLTMSLGMMILAGCTLLLQGNDKPKESLGIVRDVDIDLLPADALCFASLRVSELWNSESGKQIELKYQVSSGGQIDFVADRLGVEPADLHRILVFFPGLELLRLNVLEALQEKDVALAFSKLKIDSESLLLPIVLATTVKPFDPRKVRDRALPQSKVSRQRDKDVFIDANPPEKASSQRGKETDDGRPALYFAGERVIVQGQVEAIRAFLDLPGKHYRSNARALLQDVGKKNQALLYVGPGVVLECVAEILNRRPGGAKTFLTEHKASFSKLLTVREYEKLLDNVGARGGQVTEKDLVVVMEQIFKELEDVLSENLRYGGGLRESLLTMDINGIWKTDLTAVFFTERHAAGIGKEMQHLFTHLREEWQPIRQELKGLGNALEARSRVVDILRRFGFSAATLDKAVNERLSVMADWGDALLNREVEGEVQGVRAHGKFSTRSENFVLFAWSALALFKRHAEYDISANSLKQIGLGMHNYASQHNDEFPAQASYNPDKKPLLSWRVAILPFVGEEALYKEFKLGEPWDSPHNKKLLDKMPKIFQPFKESDRKRYPQSTFYQVFVSPNRNDALFTTSLLLDPSNFSYRQTSWKVGTVPDGTSATLLVVEADEAVPWTKPADLPYEANRPVPRLGRHWEGQFLGVLADGSAHLFDASQEKAIRAYITAGGGEPAKDFVGAIRSRDRRSNSPTPIDPIPPPSRKP